MKDLIKKGPTEVGGLEGALVTHAKMHTVIFVPDFGGVKQTLVSVSDGILPATKMTLRGQFVVLELPSKSTNAIIRTAVPVSNFEYLVLG